MQLHNVELILIDLSYGAKKDSDFVEIRDLESSARSFFDRMRESCPDIPIYILQTENCRLKDEDKLAFRRLGASGFMDIENTTMLSRELRNAFAQLRFESGMLTLARSDKKLIFKTSQSFSKDRRKAEVYLYDLKIDSVVERCTSGDNEEEPRFVKIDDIIGANEAKAELRALVEYLKNPKRYLGCGLRSPRGILLYGAEGVGKTSLAKAFVYESGVSFVSFDCKALANCQKDRGAEGLHTLFRRGKKYAPSIVLVDNVHAITDGECGDVMEAFSQEMDALGTDATRPVLVLATADVTLQKNICSEMLGRFDRCIRVDLPTLSERRELLDSKIWGNKALRITEEVMADVSKRSVGMTIAQLEGVVELALRTAVRVGKSKVGDEMLLDCFESVAGNRGLRSDSARMRAAVHTAGHALVAYACGRVPEIVSLSEARAQSYVTVVDGDVVTKSELVAEVRVALGGRAAELAYYGVDDGISSLAGSDIKAANDIAKKLVCEYGMDSGLGLAIPDADRAYSAISALLSEQMDAAIACVNENRAALDSIVDALVSKERLYRREIEELLK